MTAWKASFEQKVREVDLYFDFLDRVIDQSAELHFSQKRTWRRRKVDEEVHRILKAGAFLMLYNLIESSIRSGLTEICDALEGDGIHFGQAQEKLRALWIKDCFSSLEKGYAPPSSYRERAMTMIQTVVQLSALTLDRDNLPVSGNIDARKIREIADLYGFSAKTHRNTNGGEKLEIVKRLRNALAHGAISFAECGRDHTVPQLAEIKTQVVWYLRNIQGNIQKYIDQKKFKAA